MQTMVLLFVVEVKKIKIEAQKDKRASPCVEFGGAERKREKYT